MGLTFEWTVKFGDVLTAASMLTSALIVGAVFLYKRGGQEVSVKLTLETLTSQLSEMKAELKSIAAVLQEVALQKRDIAMLMKWYDELRRGIGRID
jgi:hypothetical protein